ncbi:MAG: SDR family oxidoreductase [Myxococcaceae bacterium]
MANEMRSKVALVTGATSGLGKETALALSQRGATVVCVARDPDRGEDAVRELRGRTGNERVELMLADLSAQRSIRALAEQFKRTHSKLHVLVNSAGVINPERRLTEDGIEETFAVNHLGYFLLTELLLDVLKASAPARIVNVASEAERTARLDLADLEASRGYGPFRSYAQSKLANMMFTYELARRLTATGVTVNAVHPGMVASRFGSRLKGLTGAVMNRALRRFMLSPAQGAETIVYLACSPEVEGHTGEYWSRKRPIRSSRESYDPKERQRLWEVSEKMTSLGGAHPSM